MSKASAMLRSPKSDWVVINIAFANDGEPRKVFFGGMEEGDMLIERGKDVLVPPSVIERLENAVVGVHEPDPENPEKMITSERRRFAYTVKGRAVAA